MNLISEMFSLEGRVAVVTGASRGIGNAIASGLAQAGAHVYGVGRSSTDQVDAHSFSYYQCDITSISAFRKLTDSIFMDEGRIDILVNAAGITLPKQAAEDPSGAFIQSIASNLTAVFECCHAIVPRMQGAGYGSIINISSIAAVMGFPGNPGYVASKGGLSALTRALALDYGHYGIRVNNLVPGYVKTAMTEGSYIDLDRRMARSERTMLGRWGEVYELVGAAVFLASQASSYVTGTDLFVDGGWTTKGL